MILHVFSISTVWSAKLGKIVTYLLLGLGVENVEVVRVVIKEVYAAETLLVFCDHVVESAS